MELCSLEGELLMFLLEQTRHPARANVLVEPAAFVLSKHRSLVIAIALTEPTKTALEMAMPSVSALCVI